MFLKIINIKIIFSKITILFLLFLLFLLLLTSCSEGPSNVNTYNKATDLATRFKNRLLVANFDQRIVKIITNGALSGVYTPVNIGRPIRVIKDLDLTEKSSIAYIESHLLNNNNNLKDGFNPPSTSINLDDVYSFLKYFGQGMISALGDNEANVTNAQKKQIIQIFADEATIFLNGRMENLGNTEKFNMFYHFIYRMIGSLEQSGVSLSANKIILIQTIAGDILKGLKNTGESKTSYFNLIKAIAKGGGTGISYTYNTRSLIKGSSISVKSSTDINNAFKGLVEGINNNLTQLSFTKSERQSASKEASKGINEAIKDNSEITDKTGPFKSSIKSFIETLKDESVLLSDTRNDIGIVSESAMFSLDDIGIDKSEYPAAIEDGMAALIEGLYEGEDPFSAEQIASVCQEIMYYGFYGLEGVSELTDSDILTYAKSMAKGISKKLYSAGLSAAIFEQALPQVAYGASIAFADSELSDLFEGISYDDFKTYVTSGIDEGATAGGGYTGAEITSAKNAAAFSIIDDDAPEYVDANDDAFPSSYPDLDEEEDTFAEEEE